MASSRTRTSTPQRSSSVDPRHLSEVARHVVIPSGIVSTGWPAVYRQIREFGDVFDQWQQDTGRLILGKRESGEFAATVGGIVLSIARQVAKTFMIGRIIFALCILNPNLTVIWTAHRLRTSDETFRKLSALAKKPSISKHIDGKPREANGQQEIAFKNGSRILFGAREGGFGRGFDEVDILVLDEAQILTEKALEDMVASTNQSRWESGALIFYMGTPPRPIDPGEAFTARRAEALAFREGAEYGPPSVGEDTVYIECSADEGADPDDRAQWAKGNPSYPRRTPLRSMLRLRKNLPSVDSWRREGLGIWDRAVLAKSLINPEKWGLLAVDDPPVGRLVVGVKFSVDGALAGLAVATKPDEKDTPVHVDGLRVASTGEGYGWIVDWCVERRERIAQIVIDGKGSDAVLIAALKDAGFNPRAKAKKPSSRFIRVPNLGEYYEAHETFLQAVTDEGLTHSAGELLDGQIAGSVKRKIGNQGGWGWQSIRDTDNTAVIDAATLAFWGATTCTRRASSKMEVTIL